MTSYFQEKTPKQLKGDGEGRQDVDAIMVWIIIIIIIIVGIGKEVSHGLSH